MLNKHFVKLYKVFSQNSSSQSKFLIVDFGASLVHTHHKQSLYAFADLVQSYEPNYEIWIPMGSEIVNEIYKIKKILLPGTHPVAFNIKKSSTWISSLHGKFHNLGLNYKKRKILSFLLNITAIFFITRLFFLRLNKNKIEILFTTICPFSIRAIDIMDKFKFNIKIYGRFTNTAETRGLLGDLIDVKKLNKIENLRLGFETNAFQSKLLHIGIVNAYSSKFPSRQNADINLISNDLKTISFLGYPTFNKGQKHILSIVKSVGNLRPEITWQIQLREEDPICSDLKSLNLNIKFFYGKISQNLMTEALKETTLLCLPYNITAFKFNSSAMMYEASDYLVPTITFSGSAFAEDIIEFNCGIAAKNESALVEQIVDLNSNKIKKMQIGCFNYNKFRIDSNLKFLNLQISTKYE